MNSMQGSGALPMIPAGVEGTSAVARVGAATMPGKDALASADRSTYANAVAQTAMADVAVQTAAEGALLFSPLAARDIASTALARGAEVAAGEEGEPEHALVDAEMWPQLPSFAAVWQPERTSLFIKLSAAERHPETGAQTQVLTAMLPSASAPQLSGMGNALERTPEVAVSAALVRDSAPTGVESLSRQTSPMQELAPVQSSAMPTTAVTESSVGLSSMASAAVSSTTRAAQPLMQALSQRILLQQAQGIDVVTVRLDPPQLGTVEVRIQHDAAGVQVVLQASHAEVGRQLAGMAEGLRQELQARSSGEATVVVAQSRQSSASAGQGGQSRENQGTWAGAEEDEIGQALLAWLPAA